MRDDVQSQLIARRTTYLRTTGRDIADLTRETLAALSGKWDALDTRLELVPGKEVLRLFRDRIQQSSGLAISEARIVDAIHRDEIPQELVELVVRVDAFRQA
ncbi:MAG TPA: hypothetical protein VFH61_11020 [Thermoleophilia bacterium]|nr:hypothetical protein [Thermoleophilia bacterium]